ncbi:MAG: cysteine hydrolase [Opitutaceae bacterium]|nr:cysteine hydrolase [Opitutaceae bacterium]
MRTLELPGRCYDMLPIGAQRGYQEETLRLPLDRTAFFPIDIYGLGYSDGEPRPEREPLWFPGSFELERTILRERIAPCLQAARRIGLPVIYANNSNPNVRGDRGEFGAVLRRTHGLTDAERWQQASPEEFRFSACVAPQPGDHVVPKLFYSAFHGTHTETLLRNLGIENLIAVGFATNACVHTTLAEAMYRNFRVILLRDCTLAMECDDTWRDLTLTKSFVRFIETHVGYTATAAAFLAACR